MTGSRVLTPESDIDRIFGVVVRKRTYCNLLYVFLSYPLSVLYFSTILMGLAAGIALAIVFVGLFILAFTLVMAQGYAALERWLASALLGASFAARPKPAGGGWKARLKSRRCWTAVLYLVLKFPLGVISLAVVLVFLVSAVMLAASVLYALAPHSVGAAWIPTREEGLLIACLGFAMAVAAAHAVNGLAALSREIATEML